MSFETRRALELLRRGSGIPAARFRDGQEEAIRKVVDRPGRLLVIQRTGWGKSQVYFIATSLLRETGAGPTLIVSPLLALMRNQIAAAERLGLTAVTINSDNKRVWNEIEARLRNDEVDVLLISPERFANERFLSVVLTEILHRIALLVIDEAHCISDWGHDFRPHYRLIERIAQTLPQGLRILATTATANNRVMQDLKGVLGSDLEILRGDLDRPSLSLQSLRLPGKAARMAWLAEQVPELPGHGIIYTLTVKDADQVAEWLTSQGIAADSYTGESGERREALEQALLDNRVKALVATTALGMGFDKPDLAFVIHYQAPGSVVAYYQQVGRAGRALEEARGVLLNGEEDGNIQDSFIFNAFPTRDEVCAVLETLESSRGGSTAREMTQALGIRKGRIDKTLALLSLELPAPIRKKGSRWYRAEAKIRDEFFRRAERITTLRRREQHQMREYVSLPSGHMEFLIRALDGDPGQVQRPRLSPLASTIDPDLHREAQVFLRQAEWARPGFRPRRGVRSG